MWWMGLDTENYSVFKNLFNLQNSILEIPKKKHEESLVITKWLSKTKTVYQITKFFALFCLMKVIVFSR